MNSNAKKKPASGKGWVSNANAKRHAPCACAAQGLTRRDLWDAVAFQWLAAMTPSPLRSPLARESVWLVRDIMEQIDRARAQGGGR